MTGLAAMTATRAASAADLAAGLSIAGLLLRLAQGEAIGSHL